MRLSQPRSARLVNRIRILDLLRAGGVLSKAEIARRLALNKVSTGEIVDALVEEGVVREAGKLATANGRRPTALELVPGSRYALSAAIGPRTTETALFDLRLGVKRFERVPTAVGGSVEDFCVGLIRSLARTVRLAPEGKVLGVALTAPWVVSEDGRKVGGCGFLPWDDIEIAEAVQRSIGLPVVLAGSLEALVTAEDLGGLAGKAVLYIDWGETITAALVRNKSIFSLNQGFGHLKVSDTGLCVCGRIGCLEASASSWALGGGREAGLRDLWAEGGALRAVQAMGRALAIAEEATGFDAAVIGGQGGSIPDGLLRRLADAFLASRRLSTPAPALVRSSLGDRAETAAAASCALDRLFFHTSFLDGARGLL